jgi:hypothetical protein
LANRQGHDLAAASRYPLLRQTFETAFSSVRAWSIWSYAYVTIAAVVIVSPLRACDS